MGEPKRTPLYEMHLKYGGRVVDFSGWALPVQYTGILDEHNTVRTKAGLFDVSHMGEISFTGAGALDLLQRLVSNDVSTLAIHQIQYAHMLYPNGGVVDDLLIYRLGVEDYFVVTNASNAAKDYEYMCNVAKDYPTATVRDLSEQTAELALQGPLAATILQKLTATDLSGLKYFRCARDVDINGTTCLISRTGYTGEDGFELFCTPEQARELWESLMTAGQDEGLQPIGLGARDSLRFEACLPLYGHELDAETTPVEAGLKRYVQIDKPDYIGREVLARQLSEGVKKTLVGFEMIDRGVPRAEHRILADGNQVGYVTTGSYAPYLDKNVGLGYVPPELSAIGTGLQIDIRGKMADAVIVKTPFYRRKK